MIFPILLDGWISPLRAPITFVLFALNLLVFGASLDAFDTNDQQLEAVLADHDFLETQGAAFAIMIQREPKLFSDSLTALARKTIEHGDGDSRRILGNLGLRNNFFMDRALAYDFGGDEVALREWREKFTHLLQLQEEHPSFQWGISRIKSDWIQYVTYQFAHVGWMHLFWNMVFLLIFGCYVETRLGSSHVALAYIGGGLIGAWSFAHLSGISSSPLVGASAAVSALMALVGVYGIGRGRLRFFFWLLPMDGYFGFVTLPSWLVLWVSLLPDLTGYLGASRDFGSIAYSAHLGGAAWGALMAGLLALGWLKLEVREHAPVVEADLENRFDRTG